MHEGLAPPGGPGQGSGWPAQPSVAPYAPVPSAPVRDHRSGMAVASLALSAAALLGVLLIGGWLVFSGAPLPGDPAATVLTGRAAPSSTGGPLAGVDLSDTVRDLVQEDGGDVSAMTCPDTPRVGQGVVTVCHGAISGADWAVIVYFEDASGRFTLNPI